MRLHLRYGRDGLDVEVPDRNCAHILRFNPAPALENPAGAAFTACAQPLGCRPLQEVVRGRRSACIAISDITRPVPNALLLAPILGALRDEGIADGDVTILVATGLHRAATDAELVEMLGEGILSRGYRIVSHDARDADSHVAVGVTSRGTRALVDRRWVEAELRIGVSLVEPHLLAGYSGGRKTVCPGLAAAETIMSFHAPAIVEDDRTRAGRIGDNPVDREACEVAALAGGMDFTINCTLDEQRRITSINAGGLAEAQMAAMEQAERQAKVVIDEPVDICVTTNAGYPLDLTLYQGIKAVWSAVNITRPGGAIIMAQECAEGLGSEEFAEMMLAEGDPHEFIRCALETGSCRIDQWAVHQYEKPMRDFRVMNYSGCLRRELQERLSFEALSSVEEGIERALAQHGPDARIAVIPEGPYVIACLRDSRLGRMTVREMMEQGR